MIPRPGSVTEKIINYIRKVGTARASQIEEALGIDRNQVPGRLAPYVAAGELVTCKVTVPGSPPQNEYRIGSGIRPLTLVDEMHKFAQARPPRPDPFPARITEPAPEPIEPAPQAATITRIEVPTEISINEHGELRYQLDGKQHHLTPAQTTALGAFLLKTEGLWRTQR